MKINNKTFDIKKIEDTIVTVPDFPIKGILFRDITPLFQKPELVNEIIDIFYEKIKDLDIDVIIGPESRGFLFGVPLSLKMNKPFVMARKPGKLPRETISYKYSLEYGTNEIQIHKDSIKPGQRILVIDDLLATGGTVDAINHLVIENGAKVVANFFLIELEGLADKSKLAGEVFSVIHYQEN